MKKMTVSMTVFGLCAVLANPVPAENLIDIYNLAVANDPQLSAVRNKLLATEELRVQSRAVLFPTIDAKADTTKNKLRTGGSFAAGAPVTFKSPSSFNSHGYSLTLKQPIFDPVLFYGLKQVSARLQQVQAEFAFAQQSLMQRVAVRYFAVLGAEDTLAFAQAETKAIGRQLEQAKQRFDVGLIAITDIHEAQARYDQAVASEIEAANLLRRSKESLREITNQSHEEVAGLGNELPLINPEPNDMDAWVQTAFAQNSQVKAIESAVEAAKQEISVRKSGHLPTVDFKATQSFLDANSSRLGSASTNEDTMLGLQVEIPIYQGGLVNSRTREAQHLFAQSQDQLEQTRRELERSTRESFMNIEATISGVKALNQALISSQSALDATELGFKVGTRTSVDVLDSQREMFRAKQALSRTRYDYILSQLQLKLAAGTLSPGDLETVNGWLAQ